MSEPFPKDMTIRDKYEPAMTIAEPGEAAAYFERCVEHTMRCRQTDGPVTREQAESIERQNLGYYAGYYDAKTRTRVERLFACTHPIFGAIAEKGEPTPEEAFAMGVASATGGQGQPESRNRD